MADWGIVPTGFRRKRYVDIMADMVSRAKANFGENVVTDTNKPLGKFLDIQAWALAELWEELEETYNAIAIDTATGVELDRIVKYKGLRRKAEATASGNIIIHGTEGIVIPLGFIVGKADGTTYTNTQAGTISSVGTVTLPFVCNFPGSRGNAEVGDVNVIITPITGVDAATNPNIITNGQDYETDTVLRQRYIETVDRPPTVESIRAAIAAVEGVVSVLVIENPLMDPDSYGNPPKSFQSYVYGGDDMKIGQAILNSKAAGIQAYGTTVVEPIDENGYTHEIGFTRADAVMVTIQVTVTRNQFWPFNGVDLIKSNILNYVGGVGPDGTQYAGLKINTAVVASYIGSLVWPVGGVVDVSVLLSRDGNPLAPDNVPIGEFEIARTSYDLITVVLT